MSPFFKQLQEQGLLQNREVPLVLSVAQYVFEVAESKCFNRNGELTNLPAKDKCPFADFDEATKAYILHEERVANRMYETFDEKTYVRLHSTFFVRVRAKKLRPRKAR